ncbi:MAG: hypothetical protein IPN72_09000 [Saprospiraceae bacterium]|nr:hypothetical protein [Saprospiraceae bacterium]
MILKIYCGQITNRLFRAISNCLKNKIKKAQAVDILGGRRNLSEILCAGTNSKILIIDSMPNSRLVKSIIQRLRQSKLMRGGECKWEVGLGYKFHLITTETGI